MRNRINPLWTPACFAVVWLAAVAAPARGDATVDFAREVLPILSENCYHCHGPDESARQAELRLDVKDGGAFRVVDGFAPIVPGDTGQSQLVRRITADDPDIVMPPADDIRKLTPKQIDTLKRWVEQGATWGTHWAFVAPRRIRVPDPPASGWGHNAIDRFIAARLARDKLAPPPVPEKLEATPPSMSETLAPEKPAPAMLAPAPQADKSTLLRRVTFDLTGLPPTPAEIDAFVSDPAPDAYEKRIDRLLASPRYGERMATDWLDLARYADTHGYQADRYRAMWPWRDWVIKAFNDNLPFDDFLTWQLAGDLLPNATKEQRLATAFNRHHPQNVEGGIVEEEFRVAYVVDRVNTFGTAVLGLTFDCSRCHDHKFDPIKQRDFYALFAFFQNIDEAGQISWFTDAMPSPTLLLSEAADDAKLAGLRRDIAAKEAELRALRQTAGDALERWIDGNGDAPVDVSGMVARYAFDDPATTRPANSVDPDAPGQAVDAPRSIVGKFGRAAELSGEDGFLFPGGVGHFTRADAFSLSIWLRTPTLAPRMVVVHKSKAPVDAGSRGYELLLEDGHIAFGLHHFWPGNAIKVVTRQGIAANEWTHVAVTYDGSSRAAGVRIYIDGAAAGFEVLRDQLTRDITYGGKEYDLAIGHRFRDNGFKGGAVDDFRVFNRALTALEVERLAAAADTTATTDTAPRAAAFAPRAAASAPRAAAAADTGALAADHTSTTATDAAAAAGRDDSPTGHAPVALQRLALERPEAVLDHFIAAVHPPALALARELADLRRAENGLVMSIPEIMVMREMPTTKPAHVLERGAYDAPGEAVGANTPAFLPPFPSDQPRNRLGLARWALSDDNPLTARVTVNRAWQQMFGVGLVETSDNFGVQGAQPTHPELLDYLAREFAGPMQWDMKRLLRTIALSATYRQSSHAAPEIVARDPANALLARGPARRLTAEMLRDQALSVSGLLVETIGGPSVKPYQPDGLWDVVMGNPRYDQDNGDGLHRRSLYTFWKRSVPPPAMTLFDAADRSNCTVRRQSTATPLQALALLNDPQIVEAARFIAERMLTEAGDDVDARLACAFRLITARAPGDRELAVLKRLYTEQRALFAADPDAAARLMAVGEKPNDKNLDRADLAAGTVLAIALFNHDAAVMRR